MTGVIRRQMTFPKSLPVSYLDCAILSVEGMILLYGRTPAASQGFIWLSEDTRVCMLQWHVVLSSTRILLISLNFACQCCSVYPIS